MQQNKILQNAAHIALRMVDGKKKSLTESFDVFKTYLFNNFKNGHAQAASEHAISINDVFLLFAFWPMLRITF